MSDSADAGSVTAPEQSAGTPAQPTAPEANGSTSEATNPFSGLQDEGTRKWVETKGYKSWEDVAKSAMHQESKLGSMGSPPAADAPAEEWDKFYSRLPEPMRPVTSPDKLEFKRPEGLPEDFAYSDDLANASKSWMSEAKLNPGQAQAMHDKFVGFMADQVKAQQAAIAESVETTHDDLVKDWGPKDSEGFKEKISLADRAAQKLGLVDAFKAKGILLPDGTLTDPQIARAMAAVSEAMFREDTIDGGGVRGGENPFKRDAAGNRNMTAISHLVKTDPERAKRMAREAGENPDVWVPSNPF